MLGQRLACFAPRKARHLDAFAGGAPHLPHHLAGAEQVVVRRARARAKREHGQNSKRSDASLLRFPCLSLALDCFARRVRDLRRAPQGTVQFGSEAREPVQQRVAVQAVENALALALG